MIKKIIVSVLGLIVVAAAVVVLVGGNQPVLKGTTNFDRVDVTDGYYVDGSTIIDGSGNAALGTVTATTVNAKNPIVFSTATTTLTAAQTGSIISIGTNGGTYTLPAVTATGTNFRFVIDSAYSGDNVVIASAEGDNISGTLIVAGAVVDCRAEDFINSIADGEAVGDFVDVYSNGSSWIIGASGVLTTAKMTCTDPS